MARTGITPTGRLLRFVLWRAPLRATQYTVAGYMATVQQAGSRWIAWGGLGLWVWGLWWLAGALGIQGMREFVGFLLLLWLWRGIVLLRWTIHLRMEAARVRAFQRQQFQMIQQLPGQLRQMAAGLPRPGGEGGIDVLNFLRTQPDPAYAEQQRTRHEQARQVRDWLPEESRDIPLGERPEPLVKMPRWMRRRGPR
jgi:hypothetical protein